VGSIRVLIRQALRGVAVGAVSALAVVAVEVSGAGAASRQAPTCIDPTGIAATTNTAESTPVGHVLPPGKVGEQYDQLLFTESGGLGSAYYLWSATWSPSAPPGLPFSFQTAKRETQQAEADAQTLGGTPTKAGAYTVSVSLREDPGAQPVAGSSTALAWPAGHPACPATTERYSLVVEPEASVSTSAVTTHLHTALELATSVFREETKAHKLARARLSSAGDARDFSRMFHLSEQDLAKCESEVQAARQALLDLEREESLPAADEAMQKMTTAEDELKFTPSETAPGLTEDEDRVQEAEKDMRAALSLM
jgi:hypothetical protein